MNNIKKQLKKKIRTYIIFCDAEIAQSVEHFTRNEGVVGSSPIFSSDENWSALMKIGQLCC